MGGITVRIGKAREALGRALRPTNLFVAVAVLVVAGSAVFADSQNRALQDQQLRAQVTRQAGVLRASLEGNINGNLQLVRGLVATLVTEPGMGQTRWSRLASQLFKQHSQLRNIAAAPDLKVTLIYPVAGNEASLGLDYSRNGEQRAMAHRARDTGRLVLAGPVNLMQGGQGFIGRFPVLLGDHAPYRFWGIVSAVVDAELLYRDSGLLDPRHGLEVALRGANGTGALGDVFFGPAALRDDNPVTADVQLPGGSWQLLAHPAGGWAAARPDPTLFRLLIGLASALVLGPLFLARHLINERARHIRTLGEREHQLDILSRRLGLALSTSEVGVWEYNIDIDRLVWDDRMNDLYGHPRNAEPRSYRHWRDAVHPDDLPRARREFDGAIRERGRYMSDYRLRLADGRERHIRAIGHCYRETDGSSRIVGVNWDVSEDVAIKQALERAKALTEARNAELLAATARIEHTSLHDALTKLPNRRYLDRALEERAAACATGGGIALLHIDLDRFKEINDTLGHAAGDAMLVHAAAVLRKNVREDDFVARIGGDEFVIVSALRNGRRDLARLAGRIVEDMRRPVPYDGHECRCGVSVGVAYQRGPKVDDKRLLMDADIALYRAKRRGRNRHEFFTEALQAEIVSGKRMADDILAGIEQGQFVAWYQPQIDARTKAISGVEALARWEHPTRGVVSPDIFLPIAEDLNVVATIDRMILEQTLAWMKVWRAQGLAVPRASVNVSGRRLREEGLIKSLRKLEMEPGTIAFELVESIYLDESDDVVAFNIDQLRELGIDIEIDDFGTGYASIVSLLKLQPRRLKIDRQLIMPVPESEAQRRLIASIVDIGHSLGIGVIAEGVETEAHARIAAELDCDILQGYAFAKPLSPGHLERFVADWQDRVVAA